MVTKINSLLLSFDPRTTLDAFVLIKLNALNIILPTLIDVSGLPDPLQARHSFRKQRDKPKIFDPLIQLVFCLVGSRCFAAMSA